MIGLAGAVGITQLWNLDIRVYHQLLEACFVEGLKLEAKYPWLPKVRTSMLAGQETRKQGVLSRVVWFYLVDNGVALLVAALGTVLGVYSLSRFGIIGAVVAACAAALAVFLWSREIRRETCSPLLEVWFDGAG